MFRKIFSCVCIALACVSTACTAEDEPSPAEEGGVVYPTLRIGVAEMNMVAESRALLPLSPDLEKYVRRIAIFEFDSEGLHIKGDNTYHFIDFQAGTVDGVERDDDMIEKAEFGVVEAELTGIPFEAFDNDAKLCLVANVTEDEVKEFYDKYREPGQTYGRIPFNRFTEWAMPFVYAKPAKEGVYDESNTGYLTRMYMFGYYQGAINPATSGSIAVDLGRLASRLDITIVNETGSELRHRLGYHFDNVCDSAYFFPMKKSMPPVGGAGKTRTVICRGETEYKNDDDLSSVPESFANGDSHTRYFYVAAHSAKNLDEATKLHLFYNRQLIGDDDANDTRNSTWVPMCNVHPDEAGSVTNGYSLSRNTRYHFTIRLKPPRTNAPSRSATPEVEAGSRPGEYIVYLPE